MTEVRGEARRRGTPARGWVGDTIRAVVLTFLWLTLGFAALAMRPAIGLTWIVLVTAAFIWYRVVRPVRRRDRRALRAFRLRPLYAPRPFLVLALPSLILAGIGTSLLLAEVADPEIAESPAWDLVDAYAATPTGFAAVGLLIAVLGPLIEEFHFRGLMQRALERRFGVPVAIVVTAAAFSLIHLHGWPWSLHPFVLGLFWGYAAHATGSIWAGVIMHSAWNGMLLIVGSTVPGLPQPGHLPAAAVWVLPLALIAGLVGFRKWYGMTMHGVRSQ